METLMKELNNLLEEKNSKITILEWEVKKLKKENEDLLCELKCRLAKENEVKEDE